ncbi:AP-5 complex subunit mu-1-like isoform X2 [Physella acuta]|uniref:AP-5 complex subunit mu-1-like isoform X2 n=1 Tax=Physella acuta TaxID=109671 RepID=UPI0027DB0A38|nr:AP-5 complex subunit mu-1-like isoform X2 [Physella acuta]
MSLCGPKLKFLFATKSYPTRAPADMPDLIYDIMSIAVRHLWIIKLSTGSKNPHILFSRSFPTVEKKAALTYGKAYVPIPSNNNLLPLLVQELALVYASQFTPSRDQCDLQFQKPVHQLTTEQGVLWPVVAAEKAGLLYCCLPLVEENVLDVDDVTKTPLVNVPAIAVGFAFIGALAEFLKVPSQELASRLQELPVFVNEAAPFGQLRDTSTENICARIFNKPYSVSKSLKLPAWRSSSYKGKPSLQLSIHEHINASQCAQEIWHDHSQVFGSVVCRAEFEGPGADITLNLSQQGDGFNVPLDMLLVHPCVQRSDWQDLESNSDPRTTPRRIKFSPPVEQFTLCHYTVRRLVELPVFGVYHLKQEETKASLTVQLKLNDQIKNNFEFCELRIPFYTRSTIQSLEATPTQGAVTVSSNKREVVWNIGQKFTSKDQQALLAATVAFSGPDQGLPAPTVEDAFCRGHNSYAQLQFKIEDFTHSGCSIDNKSVQVSPSSKYKLTISRDYTSIDYKIWNSSGEALTTM